MPIFGFMETLIQNHLDRGGRITKSNITDQLLVFINPDGSFFPISIEPRLYKELVLGVVTEDEEATWI